MGLDIEFKENQPVLCPHCGQFVKVETISQEGSSGRNWYPILESLGYYVPYDQRTDENDWYGKDMTLSPEQTKELYKYVKENVGDLYYGESVFGLIARAMVEGNEVVINADW